MNSKEQFRIYKSYLLMKVAEGDWHGVADAAMDIRELVAMNPGVDRDEEAACTCNKALATQVEKEDHVWNWPIFHEVGF